MEHEIEHYNTSKRLRRIPACIAGAAQVESSGGRVVCVCCLCALFLKYKLKVWGGALTMKISTHPLTCAMCM